MMELSFLVLGIAAGIIVAPFVYNFIFNSWGK